jgi:hypothetical protein
MTKVRRGHLASILNRDPKTFSLGFLAQSTWMLGYPEQAAGIGDAALEHARRRGHPFDLGWALTIGSRVLEERAYIASLDWARTQQAKSWELRTATSMHS